MIIEYYTHRPELSKIRTIQVGNHCIGIRMLEVVITNQEELDQLLTEKGITWAKKNLRFPPTKVVEPSVTEGKPEDWVDVVMTCKYDTHTEVVKTKMYLPLDE